MDIIINILIAVGLLSAGGFFGFMVCAILQVGNRRNKK